MCGREGTWWQRLLSTIGEYVLLPRWRRYTPNIDHVVLSLFHSHLVKRYTRPMFIYIYMYGHTRPKILTTKGSEHECRASSHMGYYHLSVEGFVTWHGLGDKLSNYGTTCLCRAWWEHSSRSWGGVVVTFSSSGGLWEVCCQRFIKMSMIQTLQRPTMEVRGCNTIECYPTWAEIYRISLNEHHFYT